MISIEARITLELMEIISVITIIEEGQYVCLALLENGSEYPVMTWSHNSTEFAFECRTGILLEEALHDAANHACSVMGMKPAEYIAPYSEVEFSLVPEVELMMSELEFIEMEYRAMPWR